MQKIVNPLFCVYSSAGMLVSELHNHYTDIFAGVGTLSSVSALGLYPGICWDNIGGLHQRQHAKIVYLLLCIYLFMMPVVYMILLTAITQILFIYRLEK